MRCLIFGTYFCNSPERAQMIRQWAHFHRELNPECDMLLDGYDDEYDRLRDLDDMPGMTVARSRDNIGHLARSGRDGWGRAFCDALDYAALLSYDYAAAIESDSLFRLPVKPIFQQMREEQAHVASVPVRGTKRLEVDWVETGLMMFNVDYVRRHELTKRYNWADGDAKRKYPHLPEWHMHQLVKHHLRFMPWSAERGDLNQITVDNVANYDWITHVPWQVCNAFVESVK